MAESDILQEAKEAFELAQDAESDNRDVALDDLRFSRLGEQWPDKIKKQREVDGRPCLTINKMPSFRRQVVNDARQNKPSIKVHPVDSDADPQTADVINGLIRNIEYTSDADVAYDTGVECAVDCGFGFWRVDIDFAFDDTFDLDILIRRITNPFSVYGDPASTAADSSDWNTAFHVDRLSKKEFERQYPDAEKKDWDFDFGDVGEPWFDGEFVQVADWWKREEEERTIVRLSDGTIMDAERLEELAEFFAASGVTVEAERQTKTHKVTRYKLNGAEVLSGDEWPGRYIPIIPVYGDEFDIEGKRYFRSLIHGAKDAQRMFNFWRTAGTELVALAPRVPYIGPKGAFATDASKWDTANTVSHPYIEYDVVQEAQGVPPRRQPLDSGVAAGALQEALNASDDMKAIIGLYDASLGARSNETSGKAIMARQREGDISTFHFIDNLSRAIKHTGRVIIDLIPHVYDTPRIVRVLGEDGSEKTKAINQETPEEDDDGNPIMEPVADEMGQPVPDPATGEQAMKPRMQVFDLTAGKYDLVVSAGPSFTTRREEAAMQMIEMVRAYPAVAPVIGDLIAKNQDWPGADEIAKRLKKMLPPQIQEDIPPELKQQIEEGIQRIQELEQENQELKADKSVEAQKAQIDAMQAESKEIMDAMKAEVDRFKAETERLKVVADAYRPVEQFNPGDPGSYAR